MKKVSKRGKVTTEEEVECLAKEAAREFVTWIAALPPDEESKARAPPLGVTYHQTFGFMLVRGDTVRSCQGDQLTPGTNLGLVRRMRSRSCAACQQVDMEEEREMKRVRREVRAAEAEDIQRRLEIPGGLKGGGRG